MWQIHSRHKRQKAGSRPRNKGQVAIETTIAIVAIFIFLLGVTQVFLWVNRNMIARQRAYQQTRMTLGSPGSIEFYRPSRLYVFPQEAGRR